MDQNVSKNIMTETVGGLINIGFSELAVIAGFPQASLAVPVVRGLVIGLIESCYNEYAQKTLSVRESKKLNQVCSTAMRTFRELAEKDDVIAWEMRMNPELIDYSYEVAEHATTEAIRQSENAKVDILGRYYGRQLYKGNQSWQDMHQIISMTSSLTLRQIVMIHLISSGFKDYDQMFFITNPSACVEVNRLKDYGIWKTGGAAFGIDESQPIRLAELTPTTYSHIISRELMLESINETDIKRVVDSLNLTTDGREPKIFTEEDYNQVATKSYVDKISKSDVDEDSAQFQYDFQKGK